VLLVLLLLLLLPFLAREQKAVWHKSEYKTAG